MQQRSADSWALPEKLLGLQASRGLVARLLGTFQRQPSPPRVLRQTHARAFLCTTLASAD